MNRLCIYGFGKYGNALYYTLKNLGIPVFCFIDNNELLKNQVLDGKICYSLNDILKSSYEYNVIVAIKNPDIIIENLKKNSCIKVLNDLPLSSITKNEADKNTLIREIVNGEYCGVNNAYANQLNYTEEKYIEKINAFRKKLYKATLGEEDIEFFEEHEELDSDFNQVLKDTIQNVKLKKR